MILICIRQLTSVQQDPVGPFVATALYRFSAFWLRSKCSICSYQLNIWYDPHVGSTILNCFLEDDEVLGACSTFVADRPGIALPPGSVHLNTQINYRIALKIDRIWARVFFFSSKLSKHWKNRFQGVVHFWATFFSCWKSFEKRSK